MNELTNNVAKVRKMKGLSQVELAEKAGISRPYLSEIETGAQQRISNVIMFRLVWALATSVDELFPMNNVV